MMRTRATRTQRLVAPIAALALLVSGALALPLLAEEHDAERALRERIDELVEQLQAEDHAERDAALEELMMLPTEALDRLRQHRERADEDDAELRWRLTEAIDALAARLPERDDDDEAEEDPQPRVQPRQGQDQPRFRFELRPPQGGMVQRSTVMDSTGRWDLDARDGRITVTFTPRGADSPEQTREFESFEQMEEEWPEAARRFRGILRGPQGRVQPPLVRPGQDRERRGPFDGEQWLPGETDMLERLLEDLLRGGGMPDADQLLEDMRRRAEEMQRRAEEMQREAERQLERFRDRDRDQRRNDGGGEDGLLNDLLRRLMDGTLEEAEPGEGAPQPRQPRAERQQQQAPQRGVIGNVGGTEFRAVPPAIRAQLQLGEREGLLVERVGEAGPLTTAGLRRFDLLLAIEGKQIESVDGVRQALEALPEGAEFTLTVVRRAERIQLIGTR